MINLFLKNIETHPALVPIILFLLGGFGTIIWFFIKNRKDKLKKNEETKNRLIETALSKGNIGDVAY